MYNTISIYIYSCNYNYSYNYIYNYIYIHIHQHITLDSALGRKWMVHIAFKSPPECAKGVSSKIALYSFISILNLIRSWSSPRNCDSRLGASHLSVSSAAAIYHEMRQNIEKKVHNNHVLYNHVMAVVCTRYWGIGDGHYFAFENVPGMACLFNVLTHVDAQSWLQTAHAQGAPHLVG